MPDASSAGLASWSGSSLRGRRRRQNADAWAAGKGDRWPYVLAGAGYALLGVVFLVFGLRRERAVDAALERGIFAPLGRLAVLGLAAGGVALGVLTFVLVVVSP